MELTIVNEAGDLKTIPVDGTTEVLILRQLIEIEFSIPVAEQKLLHDGKNVTTGTLESNQIVDKDVLLVSKVTSGDQSVGGEMIGDDPGTNAILERLRTDPTLRRVVQSNSELNAAVEAQDPRAVTMLQRMVENAQRPPGFPADENSVEAQRMIEERIQQENIERNLSDAYEFNPEAFAQVIMLFVTAEVNGHAATAFVDTGAQSTIISLECARRLQVDRLIDKRFKGVAKGVGSQTILGRIHSTVLKIGSAFLQCTFTVLEDMSYDIILGLDMLRKHAVTIDLGANCLRIHDEMIQFLPEKDVPRGMLTLGAESSRTDWTGSGSASGVGGGSERKPQSAIPNSPATGRPSVASNPASAAQTDLKSIGSSDVTEEKVRRLANAHGFSLEEAAKALQAAGGDEELAANVLLQSRYGL